MTARCEECAEGVERPAGTSAGPARACDFPARIEQLAAGWRATVTLAFADHSVVEFGAPRVNAQLSDLLGVSVTPDGQRAVSGSWDDTMGVRDLESGACLAVCAASAFPAAATPSGPALTSDSAPHDLQGIESRPDLKPDNQPDPTERGNEHFPRLGFELIPRAKSNEHEKAAAKIAQSELARPFAIELAAGLRRWTGLVRLAGVGE